MAGGGDDLEVAEPPLHAGSPSSEKIPRATPKYLQVTFTVMCPSRLWFFVYSFISLKIICAKKNYCGAHHPALVRENCLVSRDRQGCLG